MFEQGPREKGVAMLLLVGGSDIKQGHFLATSSVPVLESGEAGWLRIAPISAAPAVGGVPSILLEKELKRLVSGHPSGSA